MIKKICLLVVLLSISLVSISCLTTFSSVMTGVSTGLQNAGYGNSSSSSNE